MAGKEHGRRSRLVAVTYPLWALERRVVEGLRRYRALAIGVEMAHDVTLAHGVALSRGLHHGVRGRIRLGARVELGTGAVLDAHGGSIEIDDDCHVGPYCVIYGHGGVSIGASALIAPGCLLMSSGHTIPAMDELIRHQPNRTAPIVIGRDTWLGAGAVVLPGVTIGTGAVIAAGAVVSRDVPDGVLVAGVPARGRRRRETTRDSNDSMSAGSDPA